jgi:GT2 family glycosyltransferase
MKSAVADVRYFLAPSETLAAAFVPFGLPQDRVLRCNQGISTSRFEGVQRTASSRLRIGFAGGLQPTKGADILLDAVERLPPGRIVVDVLGSHAAYHGDRRFAESIEPRLGDPRIRRLGSVSHERMPAVLGDLDVLIVPSIWIENAPFIIREAFAAGVPVIASDLGGMREMIRHQIDGLLFPAGDAGALADAIRRILNEPELLATLRAGITRPMSIEEDADWLENIYERAGVEKQRAIGASENSPPTAAVAVQNVAAVLLNYQTADQTYLAVRSLQSSFTQPDQVSVVDNNSRDGSAVTLQRLLTDVRIIESPNNAGFSGGCNLGIRAALDSGARFILLMNSDAVLAPDALGQLIDGMSQNPEVGIAAPILLSREEPDHISSAGIAFSTRTGRMRHRAAGRRYAALGSDRFHVVDAVSGCAMLIKREVFDTIGLFDEAYFYSFEDIEFCLRGRQAGFRTMCVQDARAYHEGGRSIGRRSARRVYFGTRNHLRLASQVGDPSTRPLRIATVAALNAAYVLVSPESPLLGGSAAFVRGMWHHLRGRYGPG